MENFRSLFSCLTPCFDCMESSSFENVPYPRFNASYQPTVRLDVGRMGKNVVILKEGERICGIGGAIATVPIVQNKAYFQVTVQQTGEYLGNWTWPKTITFRQDSLHRKILGHSRQRRYWKEDQVIAKMAKTVEEGDVVGVTYDHVELKFYVNGKPVDDVITGVKGPVYPMVYVDDSAILDLKFKNFTEEPPAGFGEILVEQTIL
ncbi:Protein CBG07432 [Caenorhabditis briggsae]|uniref:Protein CBG07432 n=1 Tax=Caenorhabditis briggsae TaxID=6238 RepID=A8X4S3_CAEBR|nr:Protein CBG07432 [Caenorhabditis briggsae]CAP27633.2 Protein CBG07432 [Caenorhabditis briggsae]